MAGTTVHGPAARAWELARARHGVVTRPQLVALGFTRQVIEHRLGTGRLHRAYPGVYAEWGARSCLAAGAGWQRSSPPGPARF